MSSQSYEKIYINSIIYGGIGGLLFLLCFLTISMATQIYAFYDFVSFVSRPFFYLLGDFSPLTLIIGPPLLILYWVVIGIVISCVLIKLYYLVNSKRKNLPDTQRV
jgi:hypothetical protein